MRTIALLLVLSGVSGAAAEEPDFNPSEPALVTFVEPRRLSVSLDAGEPSDGFPSWGERVVHQWINRARVQPQAELANCPQGFCGDAACYSAQPPLPWSLQLSRAARFHSDEMGRQGFFGHDSICSLKQNIDSLYPGSCDGSSSCACAGTSPTAWSSRISLFGGGAGGEIISSYTDPNSAFYQWLYENAPSTACGYSMANGHRYIILTNGGGVGIGIGARGAVGDFGSPYDSPSKIPSGAHYPRFGSSVELWANWYDTKGPSSTQVVIDGTPVAMTLQRGTATSGAWRAVWNGGAAGCHRYYFAFTDSTGAAVRYPSSGTFGIGDNSCADWSRSRLADFNSDFRDDILLRQTSGAFGLWLMNGSSIVSGSSVGSSPGYTAAGIADFNGDGKADILLRDGLGNLGMWIMNGASIVSGHSVGSPGAYTVAGAADFNGDGRADILLRDAGGNLGMWIMNGATIVSGHLVGSAGASVVAGARDFNGDGKADILLRDSVGNLGMWIMNGPVVVSGHAVGSPGAYSVAGVGDFNGDGKSDILLRDSLGNIGMWIMNGPSLVSGHFIGSPGAYSVSSTGDYNGDGRADILLRHGATGEVGMWLMNGATISSGHYVGSPGPAYEVY